MSKPRRAPSPVARSTRAERSAWHPHDFGPTGDYPQIGRDVPFKDGPNGYPVVDYELRIQSYGEHGLRRETKCHHCHQWLSYKMCNPCQAALRMFGKDDRSCDCFKNTLYIYGRCEDHRVFQDPLKIAL